ncbi:alpha/beta fold hydrolase [Rugamonas sp. FT103W]|uniref:Alpha/beta fold hydrolase n=1 Tax=Rugamonas rivuli TaxID=2743358 RepID=A0A843SGJ5_9BURK|nr:alpha/beta fold hydrolase [Rugamonas rivuli]
MSFAGTVTMRIYAVVLLCLVTLYPQVKAQECPAGKSYEQARAVVRDLQRIVAPGGVDESYTTTIGGIKQWLNVRGQDRSNPVILFLHGGPAAPLTPSIWEFQRPIEEYFTVVNWDQRGAGKTYLEAKPEEISDSIHIDRYVKDAIEVAEFIRQRYGKSKVILMGHSWGTVIGMKAALVRPDLFYAYVGIGQVINTPDNERLSFQYGLDQARAHNNAEAIAELNSIAPYPGNTPITRERIIIARKWPQFYGGLSAYRDGGAKYYFDAPLLSPEYDCKSASAVDQGSLFTLDRILPEFLQVDYKQVHKFPIPVVMFMGRHDYTTPSAPTAAWLEQVDAPYKKGVWFERSAHMIPWEEPGKTLTSLLEYVRPLAIPASR